MRILCLIMVGAFLLTIAIADNGNAVRASTENARSQSTTTTISSSALPQPKPTSLPWILSRATRGPSYQTSSNDRVLVEDAITVPTISSTPHFFVHEPKALSSPLILEPMQRYHEKSWMDWIPDFFADESSHEPGPLIGPLEFPGMGNQVYIRHKEPEDDDTEHVVVHLINREPPPFTPAYPQHFISQPPMQHILSQPSQISNHIAYFNKDAASSPDSSYSHPGKQVLPYDFGKDALPYTLASEGPWKYAVTSSDKDVTLTRPTYSTLETTMRNSQEAIKSKSLFTEKPDFPSPGVVWNHRSFEHTSNNYGRSLGTSGELKSPTQSPFIPMSTHSSANVSVASRKEAKSLSSSRSPYSTLPSYVYLNSTRASSESFFPAASSAERSVSPQHRDRGFSDIIKRYKSQQQRQPLPRSNYLDEITLSNKSESNHHRRQVNAARVSTSNDNLSLRKPRSRFSVVHSSPIYNTTWKPLQLRRSTQRMDRGGLREVQAPNLEGAAANVTERNEKLASPSSGSTAEVVMKNIMTMTASQKWKNGINKNDPNKKAGEPKKATTPKPAVIQKRIDEADDYNNSTKEENHLTADDNNNKSEHVNEAVKKIMGSYAKWRHKVVTTDFVKELDKNSDEDKEDKSTSSES